MTSWTWTDDYSRAFAETDDPRLLAVIERDSDFSAPDGDAYAPAAFIDYGGCGYRHYAPFSGSTYQDDDAFDAFVAAKNHYGAGDERVERYMRAFHGTEFVTVRSSVHRGADDVVILSTPAYREAMGSSTFYGWPVAEYLAGDIESWQAYLNGDVYAIGYAVNESRVMDNGEPIDLDDGSWTVELECWGFYGDDSAQEAAFDFESGAPVLPPLLSLDVAS